MENNRKVKIIRDIILIEFECQKCGYLHNIEYEYFMEQQEEEDPYTWVAVCESCKHENTFEIVENESE